MKTHYWPDLRPGSDAYCRINRYAEDDFDSTTDPARVTCRRCLAKMGQASQRPLTTRLQLSAVAQRSRSP